MAALPEQVTPSYVSPPIGHPSRAAEIVPLRPAMTSEAAGPRLGPARGLLLGLVLGALMWVGIGMIAWSILR